MSSLARGISDNSTTSGQKGPSSAYAAAVIGLTVLMACLTLAPEPIESYRAEAIVKFTGEGNSPVTAAELADWSRGVIPAEGSFLDHAIEQASPTSTTVRLVATNARSAMALSDVTAVLDELSTRLPDVTAERLATSTSVTQRRVEAVEQHWNELQAKLDRLTRERTEDLIESTRQIASAKERPAPAMPAPVEDPQKARLEKSVTEARSHIAELLRTHTEVHPQVIDAKDRLREAESALAMLPVRGQPEIAKEEPVQELPAVAGRSAELAATRERLNKQIEAAETERRHWRKELAQAVEQERTGKLSTDVIASPQIVSRVGGTPTATRIMGYLLLAIASSLAMYGFAEKSERARRMSSIAEVERITSLPVAAVLPGMRRIDKEEASPLRHIVTRTTSVCEGGLAMVAVVLLIASFFGQALTVPPTQDPLGAFAEAVDRTLEPIRR
jgi:hypothetical protein